LRIRHELIHRWIDEGKNAEEIARTLSMDMTQVILISMWPLVEEEPVSSGSAPHA
jgi:hypothetical protein